MVLEQDQLASDLQLIERVRAGEIALYELLMRRHNQRVYRVIRSVVSNDLEAEDILQEAWVRAFEHLDQFAGRANFSTWVARIAFNEALGRRRTSARWTPLEDEAGNIMPELNRQQTTFATPETEAIQGQLGQMLQSAVDTLPETYRSVFVLREVEQLNTSETAECLGLSEEAVKTRLHRSRALLRHELENRMGSTIREAYSFLGARCDRVVARVLERIKSRTAVRS
jgi:RNA polymerase sigma-70 factor (ECF subfamily)